MPLTCPAPASFLHFLGAMYLLVARSGARHGLQPPGGVLAMHQMCPGLADQLTERQRDTEDEIRFLLPKPSDLGGEGTDLRCVPDLLRIQVVGHDPIWLQPVLRRTPRGTMPQPARADDRTRSGTSLRSRARRSSRSVKYSRPRSSFRIGQIELDQLTRGQGTGWQVVLAAHGSTLRQDTAHCSSASLCTCGAEAAHMLSHAPFCNVIRSWAPRRSTPA